MRKTLSAASRRSNVPAASIYQTAFYVWILLLFLVAHLLLYFVFKFSVESQLQYSLGYQFALQDLPGTPRLSSMSAIQFSEPCNFNGQINCRHRQHDSKIVRAIDKQKASPLIQDLLARNSYDSAFDVARDLLVLGHEQDVINLLRDPAFAQDPFEAEHKNRFATRWYLNPALDSVDRGRYYEAVGFMISYIEIMKVPVDKGHWISKRGLDPTDIPPIADIFCETHEGRYSEGCLLLLLSYITRDSNNFPNLAEPSGARARFSERLDAYFRLFPSPEASQLKNYIAFTSQQVGAYAIGEAELTPSAISAFHYTNAIKLLEEARQSSDCQAALGKSLAIFREIARNSQLTDYFVVPARHRIEFISREGTRFCRASK